jgi:hypothetical protein
MSVYSVRYKWNHRIQVAQLKDVGLGLKLRHYKKNALMVIKILFYRRRVNILTRLTTSNENASLDIQHFDPALLLYEAADCI